MLEKVILEKVILEKVILESSTFLVRNENW